MIKDNMQDNEENDNIKIWKAGSSSMLPGEDAVQASPE